MFIEIFNHMLYTVYIARLVRVENATDIDVSNCRGKGVCIVK